MDNVRGFIYDRHLDHRAVFQTLGADESQASYGGYCYRVADGILRDARDSEESVNDTWLAAWNAIPPTRPNCLKAYFGALTRRISVDRLRRRSAAKRGA